MEHNHDDVPADVLAAIEASRQDLVAHRVKDARPVQERLQARLEDAKSEQRAARVALR